MAITMPAMTNTTITICIQSQNRGTQQTVPGAAGRPGEERPAIRW
jgi:hypothetical protein